MAKRILTLLSICLSITCASLSETDQQAITVKARALFSYLDGPAYARSVGWTEHIVLCYALAADRRPTPLEVRLLTALRDDPGFLPSHVLGLALRGGQKNVGWEACAAFLERVHAADFVVSEEVRGAARALRAAAKTVVIPGTDELSDAPYCPRPVKQTPDVPYETYFGFLHAHSHLSLDAEGDPNEAYRYAREEGGLDFFSLTDHGVYLFIWPWEDKWRRLRDAADAADRPGEFVALWGFEWSNPILGHMSIVNTEDYTDTVRTFRLNGIYDWLAARPEGFGHLNHPGDYDSLGFEANNLPPYGPVVEQMAGIETWNTDGGFGEYHYGGYDGGYAFIDTANRQGWRLGALGAQDNHHMRWGTRNEFRTGVLATELTREAIMDAYRARRFYATEDRDLFLDVRCAGYPMGARLATEPRVFEVTASDGSGDSFAEARLYRNGDLIETIPVNAAELEVTFNDTDRTGEDYYYVTVRQLDDNDGDGRNDEAISSPIWFGTIPVAGPACNAAQEPPVETSHTATVVAWLAVTGALGAAVYRRTRDRAA